MGVSMLMLSWFQAGVSFDDRDVILVHELISMDAAGRQADAAGVSPGGRPCRPQSSSHKGLHQADPCVAYSWHCTLSLSAKLCDVGYQCGAVALE